MSKYKKSETTQRRILETANKLFSECGYQNTGIDEIAGAIGMTSGVVYSQFKSKSEVFNAMMQNKIERSQETLLVVQQKESAHHWIQRALRIYLSSAHRDSKSESCPLTTLSTEIIQLGLQKSTGLLDYTRQFAEVLQRRLLIISPENKDKAHAIMSLCVGAIILSRLEKDQEKSQIILDQAYTSALSMVVTRGIA